ncbi:hypothetical protein ROHU_012986 [Labeo rohita]|uniref:Peptidase aspartic putative domain-containing protein n=2 Tax=Labeo rohita TaxID=84645 RepID=A0A498LG15_LABRO|nr:hypothetical protein ROHU_012986 [Labeo rohita]
MQLASVTPPCYVIGLQLQILKTYLGGEARKAVEGFFYRNSEDAYKGAWKVLEEQYGNPFIVQRAFREKLMRWPKIGVNDLVAIVPVFISVAEEPQNEILTYALLDTQSDTTFIMKDFLEELHVNCEGVKLKLSTMTTTDTLNTSHKIRGLRVRGLQGEKYIQVPQAYTCDFIPVDRSYIPTKKTALQWPHLKCIAYEMPPLQSCDIGMLIGYDCPSALAPLEVITGGDDEPFAQKTSIGWSIIGLCNPHLDRQGNQSFVHQVSVKEVLVPSAIDVLKLLESDFNERHPEDKHVSQEDIRFIRLLSDNVQQKEDGHYQLPLPFKSCSAPLLPNNKKLAMA